MGRPRKSAQEDNVVRRSLQKYRRAMRVAQAIHALLVEKQKRGDPLELTRADVEELTQRLSISRPTLYRYRKLIEESELFQMLFQTFQPDTFVWTDDDRLAMGIVIGAILDTLPGFWAERLQEIARHFQWAPPKDVRILKEPWTRWLPAYDDVFKRLLVGIREQTVFEIVYRPPGQSLERFFFRPYRIYRKRRAWYVGGVYFERLPEDAETPIEAEVRLLRLNRIRIIRKVPPARQIAARLPPFTAEYVDAHFRNAWEFFGGDTLEIVRFRALNEKVRDLITEVVWHPHLVEVKRGLFEVRVAVPEEMIPWLLQWMPDIEVLAPDRLRRRIYEIARSVVDRHEDL